MISNIEVAQTYIPSELIIPQGIQAQARRVRVGDLSAESKLVIAANSAYESIHQGIKLNAKGCLRDALKQGDPIAIEDSTTLVAVANDVDAYTGEVTPFFYYKVGGTNKKYAINRHLGDRGAILLLPQHPETEQFAAILGKRAPVDYQPRKLAIPASQRIIIAANTLDITIEGYDLLIRLATTMYYEKTRTEPLARFLKAATTRFWQAKGLRRFLMARPDEYVKLTNYYGEDHLVLDDLIGVRVVEERINRRFPNYPESLVA